MAVLHIVLLRAFGMVYFIISEKLDEKWKWLIVLGSFINQAMAVGMLRCAGMFYDEWMDYFGGHSSTTSALGMTTGLVASLLGPMTTTLIARYDSRPVAMVGGVLVSAGFFASSFASNLYMLFATYGLLIGVGFTFANSALKMALVRHFPKKTALVNGIASSGVSIGGILLPIMIQRLIEEYSWRGTFIIISAMSLNMCVSGALVLPNNHPKTIETDKERTNLKTSLRNICSNTSLLSFYVSTFFTGLAIYTIFIHIKSATIELADVSEMDASFGISFVNCGALVSVVSLSILLHKCDRIQPILLHMVLNSVFGILAFVLPFIINSLPEFIAICSAIGLCITPFTLLIVKRLVGLDETADYNVAYGIVLTTKGLGTLLGPLFAGYMYDITGDYTNSFYIAGAAMLASVPCLLKPCLESYGCKLRKCYETNKLDCNVEGAIGKVGVDNPAFSQAVDTNPYKYNPYLTRHKAIKSPHSQRKGSRIFLIGMSDPAESELQGQGSFVEKEDSL